MIRIFEGTKISGVEERCNFATRTLHSTHKVHPVSATTTAYVKDGVVNYILTVTYAEDDRDS